MEIRYAGGPTAVVEIGGLRLVTDPTFDPPGKYPIGDWALEKTSGPAFGFDDIGPVDAVLLSHDQHPDNLDNAGRIALSNVPLVLSTESAASRLPGVPVRALSNWAFHEFGESLRVTGVPAQHGPPGTEHLLGEVTGFVLSGDGLPTVYVSGDNASLDVVRAVARWAGRVDVALLFAGRARAPFVDGDLTLSSEDAVRAAEILGVRYVVPLHFEHWEHFTQGRDTVARAFAGSGDRLRLLAPGERVSLS
ncbi:MBL fold metallo-hydrolase [Nonomuraea zeae]|uniref:MBL fold metallo-hydrolase n=1 Tax=Nonomuraea zeae TaxID=1642303 RepID=A0A5S4G2S3_9ACTN|nr:MBL fold metallo-hydrolase [Nonomuraea zeae]TMR27307.1 MBL fold metallo-hydrolase [Nonomuraea zeae]